MSLKRPTIKGMGAKLFETNASGDSAAVRQHDGTLSRQHDDKELQNFVNKWPKATFYLPVELQDRLDKAWIARRNQDRRIKKSDLVREALDVYLAELERRRFKTAG